MTVHCRTTSTLRVWPDCDPSSPNDHLPLAFPPLSLPSPSTAAMKIKTSFQDVKTSNGTTMRVYIYEPNLPEYPQAKWPGVVCFSGQSTVRGQTGRARVKAVGIVGEGCLLVTPVIRSRQAVSSWDETEGGT